MADNKEQLQKLRELIFTTLDPIIDKDYCVLDIPDYTNIGDQLIYEGQLAYLERLKYKMLYVSNDKYTIYEKIPKDSIILLQGGGNFGDIWRGHQNFRLKIIQKFPNNKIIVFPQTVYYKNEKNIIKDAEIFSKHPDLTICTRDEESYKIVKQYFVNNKALLLPDMAFCLDLTKYHTQVKTSKALIMQRKDKELNKDFDIEAIKKMIKDKKIEVEDWPTMVNKKPKFKLLSLVNFLNKRISNFCFKYSFLRPILDSRYGLIRSDISKFYLKEGIKFMNQYDVVYTTRLHGYILSILLNKEVHILDNSYGKNSTFYNAWTKNFVNSSCIKQ